MKKEPDLKSFQAAVSFILLTCVAILAMAFTVWALGKMF